MGVSNFNGIIRKFSSVTRLSKELSGVVKYTPDFKIENVKDRDWDSEWKKALKLFKVVPEFWICPSWCEPIRNVEINLIEVFESFFKRRLLHEVSGKSIGHCYCKYTRTNIDRSVRTVEFVGGIWPGGTLLLSGILEPQVDRVMTAFDQSFMLFEIIKKWLGIARGKT